MRKFILLGLLSFLVFGIQSQSIEKAQLFQNELDNGYKDSLRSPLLPKDQVDFNGHPFYPISEEYIVEADFVLTPGTEVFEMPTTTKRKPKYRKYAEARFMWKGEQKSLALFQSQDLKSIPEFEKNLFLPFNDFSNGNETYGGGRFIDIEIPEGDKIIIDFNQAYNPLCAYNHQYSCPIPPDENKLDFEVKAGVQYNQEKYH